MQSGVDLPFFLEYSVLLFYTPRAQMHHPQARGVYLRWGRIDPTLSWKMR